MSQSKKTEGLSGAETTAPRSAEAPLPNIPKQVPERLGRYEVRLRLGQGGFGTVYMGWDSDLDRSVAIKIPNRKRFRSRQTLDSFLSEAKMSARLHHEGIVTVFDVGWEGEFPFIVLEYVRGRTLAEYIRSEPRDNLQTARIVRQVADALYHAHCEGFIHRDLKPSNILLDAEDRPLIGDFGLAIRNRGIPDVSKSVVGTPPYMSPEQALGENHRLDERSDIWAVGVILYQMLCGQLPFRETEWIYLRESILQAEFPPPSSIAPDVTPELERICQRCLSRQMSQRYRRASDLSADLSFAYEYHSRDSSDFLDSDDSSIGTLRGSKRSSDCLAVPRGLRPFRGIDAEFFHRLLPGPRDRDGTPLSVQFWIEALESRDSASTFRVGLLYGPSGCGKTSFVNAGVLPKISPSINAIYVDATHSHWQEQLCARIDRQFPYASQSTAFAEKLQSIRERLSEGDSTQSPTAKVVIVIDQIEQYLAHRHAESEDSLVHDPVVKALRQCDGGTLQAVLMVRDDFWLPISRMMNALESSIVDGENAMLLDSFDAKHAKRVLTDLGRSLHCLPVKESEITDSQLEFLDASVCELSSGGRLFPVRLAVFVDLVSGEPWNISTLQRLGGTQGIGVSFLEHAFGREASAARRIHSEAARHVLAELLPVRGDIRKSSVPKERLFEVSGYHSSNRDFEAFLKLLDRELRLLTPVQQEGLDTGTADSNSSRSTDREGPVAYQLTHDFLVPSVRLWLEREMRGQRGGRQLLLLREQAATWNDRPSNRFLPTVAEYIQFRIWTQPEQWTPEQAKMMTATRERIFRQIVAAGCFSVALILASLFFYSQQKRKQARLDSDRLLKTVQSAPIDEVPAILDRWQDFGATGEVDPDAIFNNSEVPIAKRLRMGLAALRRDAQVANRLVQWLVLEDIPSRTLQIAASEVSKARQSNSESALKAFLSDPKLSGPSRFRAAALYAQHGNVSAELAESAEEWAAAILQQNEDEARIYIELFEPLGTELLPWLRQMGERELDSQESENFVIAVHQYESAPSETWPEILGVSNPNVFRSTVDHLRAKSLANAITQYTQHTGLTFEKEKSKRQRRVENSLALGALLLGDESWFRQIATRKWSSQRAELIALIDARRLSFLRLTETIRVHRNSPELLTPLVLSASRYPTDSVSRQQIDRLRELLVTIGDTATDPELIAATQATLLATRDAGSRAQDEITAKIASSLEIEQDCFRDETLQMDFIVLKSKTQAGDYRFAISTTELPLALYSEFLAELDQKAPTGDLRQPATSMSIQRMAAVLNWCSKRSKIPGSQWCFTSGKSDLSADAYSWQDLAKTGYRFPTSQEWTIAAGETNWLEDCEQDTRDLFAFGRESSGLNVQPVRQLYPNPNGIFDMFGNVQEPCALLSDSQSGEAVFVNRGGSVLTSFASFKADIADKKFQRSVRDGFTGIRIARTVSSNFSSGQQE